MLNKSGEKWELREPTQALHPLEDRSELLWDKYWPTSLNALHDDDELLGVETPSAGEGVNLWSQEL